MTRPRRLSECVASRNAIFFFKNVGSPSVADGRTSRSFKVDGGVDFVAVAAVDESDFFAVEGGLGIGLMSMREWRKIRGLPGYSKFESN